MSTLCLAAVLQCSMMVTGAETYAEAHRDATQTGRPMVVMVGAEWCAACKQMERDVLPEVRKQQVFKEVSFAKVDLDKERKLGEQLTKGGPIPQIIMYRKSRRGWLRRKLIGRQSPIVVQAFITDGVKRNHEDNQEASATPDVPTDVGQRDNAT